MGKVDENKHQKMDALFQSAYDLFLNQGIEKTSISDIAKKAGVAKGTFYLYIADKYEIRDRQRGFKEVTLLGQNVNSYGLSPSGKREEGMVAITHRLLPLRHPFPDV